jgi:MYXO-CTERM domain-containing protein
VGGGSTGNGSGGGNVGAHGGCSVAGTPEPEPLAPLAGLLLGAALTFSRRKRG